MSSKLFEDIHIYERSGRQPSKIKSIAHQWDHRIKNSLLDLGHRVWPDHYLLGIIPVPSFRLRHEFRPGTRVWWIEHDIPPYDRYQCAAYGVELSLQNNGQPFLTIRDGIGDRILTEPTIGSFEKTLSKAAQRPPMIIPRKFGPANE